MRLHALAEHRHRDPVFSLHEATTILATASDPALEVLAAQVVGLALHELGRFADAVASYRRAIAMAVEHHLADGEAMARAHLATALIALGDAAGAKQEIAAAQRRSSAASRGVVALRHGVVLQRTGLLNEALVVYDQAQRWLDETGDQPHLAVLRIHRGILHTYQGHHSAAVEDLALSEQISRARDLPVLTALATHNLGFSLSRQGKLPDALAVYARTKETYLALGNKERLLAVVEGDRCEVLMLAGLVADALVAARWAVDILAAVGDKAELMEGRLVLARVLLAAGDSGAARVEATRAAEGFSSAGRSPWAALARYVAVQAEILEHQDQAEPSPEWPGLLRRCRRIAVELETEGWPVESAHVHTLAGRIALALGRDDVARAELAGAAAARTRGSADLRARAWHADALLRLAGGDRGGAKRSLARGMSVVDEHRASLGATELRVHAASYGADLARLGTRLAVEDRRAADVLRWAERWRAGTLRRPSVRPPSDERLAQDLSELRQAYGELRSARLNVPTRHRRAGVDADPGVTALQGRIRDLEAAVRNHTLEARDDTVGTGRVDLGAIRRSLGQRWLVEYVALEGQLYAVTVSATRARLHRLGSVRIAEEKDYLLFAIRRLMATPASRAAAATVAATAARLDRILVEPLGLPPDAPLVVVPTGLLHGLPWATLPSLTGRPTTVASSAAAWRAPAGWRRPGTEPHSVALVAGPHLPGADDEVRLVAELYPGARPLWGPHASAVNVVAGIEQADVVHLAAHGSFRADSPLFSSVLLADGPITVYELERLRRAPHTVVLASCEAAVSAVHLGDELLGTAAALIGLGVGWVIAPVMRVPDRSTAPFMVALHRRMIDGEAPATALARAADGQDPAVAAAFVCIGCDEEGRPTASSTASQ